MWNRLRSLIRIRTRTREFFFLAKTLGMAGALAYLWQSLLNQTFPNRTFRLVCKESRFPLMGRNSTSDIYVFRQVFLDREYAALGDLKNVDLVLDCGANVGYTAAFFLTRFPHCHLIAIEPDSGNFQLLKTNLAPFGDRVTLLHSALWDSKAQLKLSTVPYRGGGEWARQVRECEIDEKPDLEAIDIASVLALSGKPRISILKMDIEGAEAVVFRAPCSWLGAVDNLAIELHDDSQFGNATEAFEKAIEGHSFLRTTSGELVICRRPDPT